MTRQRLTVQGAAEVLGTSVDAVRSRIRRGSLESEKDPDGRVYVWIGDDQARDEPQGQVEASRELVDTLRAQVEDLRDRLDREQDAHAEARRIIAGLVQRIPELEPPQETPAESAESPERGAARTERGNGPETPPAPAKRPWWRRVFGP